MTAAGAETGVRRTPLGSYLVDGGKHVGRVDVHRLTLAPGGKTGLHTHPGPVVSYVVEGRIVVQVEGKPARTFGPGETIFEPAQTRMLQFDNESATKPAIFIATYLLSQDDGALIHMIE
jgi:quercetin dioxygenase-like cupin family protein